MTGCSLRLLKKQEGTLVKQAKWPHAPPVSPARAPWVPPVCPPVALEVEEEEEEVEVKEEVELELWATMVALKRQLVSSGTPRTSRPLGNEPTERDK